MTMNFFLLSLCVIIVIGSSWKGQEFWKMKRARKGRDGVYGGSAPLSVTVRE